MFKYVNSFHLCISVRGALVSVYDPAYNVGVLISFFLGNNFELIDQVKILFIAPTIFVFLFFLIPESPEFLDTRNEYKVVYYVKCAKISSN